MCDRRDCSRSASWCSSAARSAAGTEACVRTRQAVGQRVTPLLRMNSATAASYSLEDGGAVRIGFSRLRVIAEHPVRSSFHITVPPASSAQFRMLLRFSPGIAGRNVAPPCRHFFPPGRLRELVAASRDEHAGSFRFVRKYNSLVLPC